jgi:formate-dependent nitrite reductase cytochrome c552 subunit
MKLILECLAVYPTSVELMTEGGIGAHLDLHDTSEFEEGEYYEVNIAKHRNAESD